MTKGKVMGADQVRFGGSRMMAHELYAESKCALCGKKFLRTGAHVYRREDHGTKWYCSYTCFRVKAREDEAKEREKYEREVTADARREAQLAERRRWKRLKAKTGKNWERRIFFTQEDADEYAGIAREKIAAYEQQMAGCAVGTDSHSMARRNWRRSERSRLRSGAPNRRYAGFWGRCLLNSAGSESSRAQGADGPARPRGVHRGAEAAELHAAG